MFGESYKSNMSLIEKAQEKLRAENLKYKGKFNY